MSQDAQAPKIIVDDDWKAQAQAEKAKLAEKAKTAAPASKASATPGVSTPADPSGQSRKMPPATFETLVSTLATQALFAMGAVPDPQTGQPMMHLDLARHHIDMLTVLDDKCEGNLTEEENDLLSQTLYELRNRYVQISSASRG